MTTSTLLLLLIAAQAVALIALAAMLRRLLQRATAPRPAPASLALAQAEAPAGGGHDPMKAVAIRTKEFPIETDASGNQFITHPSRGRVMLSECEGQRIAFRNATPEEGEEGQR